MAVPSTSKVQKICEELDADSDGDILKELKQELLSDEKREKARSSSVSEAPEPVLQVSPETPQPLP